MFSESRNEEAPSEDAVSAPEQRRRPIIPFSRMCHSMLLSAIRLIHLSGFWILGSGLGAIQLSNRKLEYAD